MLEKISLYVELFWKIVPFSSATWMVLFLLTFIVIIIGKASRDPASDINWEHLIVNSGTNRVSPYKLGYLIGVIVSTWLVLALVDGDKLTVDILVCYLTYLLGGAGWAQYTRDRRIKQGEKPGED